MVRLWNLVFMYPGSSPNQLGDLQRVISKCPRKSQLRPIDINIDIYELALGVNLFFVRA